MRFASQDDACDHSRRQRVYFETTGYRTLRPTGSPYLRRHVQKMMEFARVKPGQRVLEVGCGMGRYTIIFKELGVEVEGLDLSLRLLEQLQSHAAGRFDIPVHALDLIEVPEEMAGRYDAVLGFFVLHHVHDVAACIKAATRLVKPEGRVAFLEPNPLNPLYYAQIFGTPGMRWSAEKGLLKMTRSNMLPLLEEAGLKGLSFSRFGFFPPFVTNRPFGTKIEGAFERLPPFRRVLPFQMFGGSRS